MPSVLSRPFLGFPVYAWLIGLGVTGIAVIYFLRNKGGSTASPQTATTVGSAPAPPIPYPTASIGADQSGQNTNTPAYLGSSPGQDPGWFYGPLPTRLPSGTQTVWRWSTWYIQAHQKDMPWLSPQAASGYGPPDAPNMSWEYQIIPSNAGQPITTQSQQFGSAVLPLQ